MSNMSFPEIMYYAESEGLLPTRIGKINAFINDINNYHNSSIIIGSHHIIELINKYNLEDLTVNEINYINSKIKGAIFYI